MMPLTSMLLPKFRAQATTGTQLCHCPQIANLHSDWRPCDRFQRGRNQRGMESLFVCEVHQHAQRKGENQTTAVEQYVVGLEVSMKNTLAVNKLQAADDLYCDANLHDIRQKMYDD